MDEITATLKSAIEQLSTRETIDNPDEARRTFFGFRARLTRGELRAAQKVDGHWVVNAWVKQGILLGFRLGELKEMSGGDVLCFVDKDTFPPRRLTVSDRVRPARSATTTAMAMPLKSPVVCSRMLCQLVW